MYDIISIGELLIDMFPSNVQLSFAGIPGGAPCNLVAQAAKLGRKTAVISMVGNDYFGRYLKDYVANLNIDPQFISFTDDASTTLAFVNLDENGDRSFSFYRKPGADMLLSTKNIPIKEIKSSRIFSYGGVALSEDPLRSNLLSLLRTLSNNPKLVTAYDPNLREPLWREGRDTMRSVSLEAISYADILKISDEELLFLTQEHDLSSGINKLTNNYKNIKICAITCGAKGCFLWHGKNLIHLPTYDTSIVDTTGAGDSFFGAFLHKLLSYSDFPWELDAETLFNCVRYANAAGALTASGKGAIASMPDNSEIEFCMASTPILYV